MSAALKLGDRAPELQAFKDYLDVCYRGDGGKYFMARHRGQCCITGATIKPYQQIVRIADVGYARKDAVAFLDARGNDTPETIAERFAWFDADLAREWFEAGGTLLVYSAASLKVKWVRKVDDFKALRSPAFMVRRRSQ